MAEQMRFDGKVVVVTGAGNGLGRTYALQIASRGGKVVVNDLGGAADGQGGDQAAANRVVDEIRAAGGEATANFNSVATAEGGRNILDTALDTYGRVDAVIANAGILRDRSFAKLSLEELDLDPRRAPARHGVHHPAGLQLDARERAAGGWWSPPRRPACSAASARPTIAPPSWASSA